ncbi:Uncharacterized protein Rs2_00334 [Raphanus sativus]|nr:Uncharacterized protein Rs2_00334 [Raphanus sativus]
MSKDYQAQGFGVLLNSSGTCIVHGGFTLKYSLLSLSFLSQLVQMTIIVVIDICSEAKPTLYVYWVEDAAAEIELTGSGIKFPRKTICNEDKLWKNSDAARDVLLRWEIAGYPEVAVTVGSSEPLKYDLSLLS